jgi:hypothetical protein
VASGLSRAQATVTLPGEPTLWTSLLQTAAGCAAWRLLELSGDRPFDLEASWSAGDATGLSVTCTVARSTRLCLYATSLDLRIRNRSATAGKVSVIIVDTFLPTENVHQTDGDATAGTAVSILPAAVSLRLELANADGLPDARLRLLDPDGTVRADLSAASQPSSGVTVGGAASVEVVSPQSRWRLLTFLSL